MGPPVPSPLVQLERDPHAPRRGRIAERTLNLGGGAEIRRYAYDSAGRLARVADGAGGLLECSEGEDLAQQHVERLHLRG